MVDDETQTLEEGKRDPAIPMKVMITKNGRAAHCRNDCPFFLNSHSIRTLRWCSHCDPSDALEKRTWRRRVLHLLPVTDIPAPQSTVAHQFRHQFPVARILTT